MRRSIDHYVPCDTFSATYKPVLLCDLIICRIEGASGERFPRTGWAFTAGCARRGILRDVCSVIIAFVERYFLLLGVISNMEGST